MQTCQEQLELDIKSFMCLSIKLYFTKQPLYQNDILSETVLPHMSLKGKLLL